MSHFDYITNFVTGSKTAKMALDRKIGGANGINGSDFALAVDYLVDNGIEELIVEINSPGGSIVEGFSIFNAIKNAPVKTVTKVVGISASMAGIISQAGDERIIMDYGIFHAHGPQVPEGAKVEEDMINKMLGSLKILISSKADIKPSEVDEMLSKETVLTAVEAKEKGFFDRIEITKGLKPKLDLKAPQNFEEAYLIANQFLNNNKMDKIGKLFSLENANEDQIVDSVKELQAEAGKVESLTNELSEKTTKIEELTDEVATLETEKKETEAKVEDLTAQVDALKLASATELVENAIKAGKISDTKKDAWISQAVNDYDNAKELIGSVKGYVKAEDLTNAIDSDKKAKAEDRKDWDFQKWGQEDPKGLEAMMTEDPETYEALFNAYVGE